jgi:putative molybdopterin biosynthesis protein
MHQYDLAGEAPGFAEVMRRHDHLDAADGDGPDHVLDRFGRRRIEACGRLVEEEHLWVLGQRARECEPLLLAAGQLARRARAEPVEADQRQQLGDARFAGGARDRGSGERIADIGAGAASQHRRTTEETAAYLRLSERKLYELVANGAVPCTKVTGKWLFPKIALDRWLAAGLTAPAMLARAPAAPIVGGSHDPLLEWALRESGCGLASLPEGSEAGLRRLARDEVALAAIHLHRLDGDDEDANGEAVAAASGLHDAVVIAFARREQGLVVAAGNPLALGGIADVAAKQARLALRPPGAGAQLLLLALVARAALALEALAVLRPPCATGPDIAQAVRGGRADCGIATRAVAAAAGLDFVPLTWERFDLALRQRSYFLPSMQALFKFTRGAALRERAAELGGYDVSEAGAVRAVN